MIKFLDLQAQYLSIKEEIDHAVLQVLSSAQFVGGEYVKRFEEQFASALGVKYALGVANGTEAIELALKGLNLPKDSEVILPANTFFGSLEGVVNAGLKSVIVDCGEDYCISPLEIEKAITPKTSAILVVHLYGRLCDMPRILEIAKKHNLRVIEDCAQSYGAKMKINGEMKMAGSIGDVGCFSFYPGKNLGAYGDGGAISTNDKEIFELCTSLANHGRGEHKYTHKYYGRNSRLDGIQSAILSVKLKYINEWNEIRKNNAEFYASFLKDIPQIILPKMGERDENVWHLYVVRIEGKREEAMKFLLSQGIQSGIHYPISLPELEACKELECKHSVENAKKWSKDIFSLPMGEHLGKGDIEKVAENIRNFVKCFC